jgi:uncharacterized Ntn-hydrolase superfamily protein
MRALRLIAPLLFVLGAPPAISAGEVATFSIVARDEATGDFGVAVESRFFNVGAVCPWAKAGVGAISTQAFANYSYGPEGLKLLEQGLTAQQVVERLTGPDEQRDRRQLAVIDAQGNVAAWTGSKCNSWAGHRTGKNYSVQGNILAGEEVLKGMERGFLESQGTFAERLVAALEGGQAAGGDARGKQSAALLVVRKNSLFGSDRFIDLRVDDHPEPIRELARLLAHYQALRSYGEAARLGQKDPAAGIQALEAALKKYEADDSAHYLLARLYARMKNTNRALAALRRALELNPVLWKNASTEADFESLRHTEEFKRLR